MKVFVTGGTGFVGSHIVSALVAAGHDVRLLVRRPEQVAVSFAPHGIEPSEVVVGDARDSNVVARGIDGCDSVVHAAAVFSLRRRDAQKVAETNVAATRTVLDAAAAAAADPIVHVSSTAALTRRDGSGPDLPLGDQDDAYGKSKLDCERVARELQDMGAPVVSIYPGGVLGPHDPYLGEQDNRLAWVARGLFPIWPRGGYHSVDVRDVAAAVAGCVEPRGGGRRYIVPGTHVDGDRYFSAVVSAIGHRRPHVETPTRVARALAASMRPVNAVLPDRWYYPADADGIAFTERDTRFDDSPARTELGITPRAFEDTVRDTLTWLVDAGHLPARLRPKSLVSTTVRGDCAGAPKGLTLRSSPSSRHRALMICSTW